MAEVYWAGVSLLSDRHGTFPGLPFHASSQGLSAICGLVVVPPRAVADTARAGRFCPAGGPRARKRRAALRPAELNPAHGTVAPVVPQADQAVEPDDPVPVVPVAPSALVRARAGIPRGERDAAPDARVPAPWDGSSKRCPTP